MWYFYWWVIVLLVPILGVVALKVAAVADVAFAVFVPHCINVLRVFVGSASIAAFASIISLSGEVTMGYGSLLICSHE